ncbi:protein Aster-A isoform X1 [Drosophila eugracilis]|uniref:protein Aster-A isoform X1 n=1 Tax=Drosophila eugracilis TaxID=29029 RepID=UPI0007E81E17|nr:protein Aster-A isoform X1 [Drosophila eugracilis]
MKSITARLKYRFGKPLEMDKSSGTSNTSNRINQSNSSRRNSATHRGPQPSDEFQALAETDTTKNRLFWGSRRGSTAAKNDRRSKTDLTAGGKKKQILSPRQSAFTQTDRGRKSKVNNMRNTRCNSLVPSALPSRETIRPTSGKRGKQAKIDKNTLKTSSSKLIKYTTAPITIGTRKQDELTARCSASHEGRKLLQERLMSFHDRRKSTDLKMGGWKKNAEGRNERIVTVTVALQANLGPKTAKVTETQVMRECSQPGQLYSIDVQTVNAEIPYADAFVVLMHFCLKATVEEYTDVLVYAQIKFLKSVWAVVKAFIEKNAYAGLEEFCHSLYSALLVEIKKR